MARRIRVHETIFGATALEDRKRYYTFWLPEVSEAGFYRSVVSFNAFFHSMASRNWTDRRLFIAQMPGDPPGIGDEFHAPHACADIWEFYQVIGYDYKTKRYTTGERTRKWQG